MSLTLDPEVQAAIAPLMAAMAGRDPIPVGDCETRRQLINGLLAALTAAVPRPEGVTVTVHEAQAGDGARLALRWYRPTGAPAGTSGPAALYLHGGGMICGSVDIYEPVVASYVAAAGTPMLSVEYRLAPEHPHPTPVEDCYAALEWLAGHAAHLGVDPARIAVMGDSAGGGLAAGVALMARDRGGPPLRRQILVYPMLDDRTTAPDAHIAPFATWTYDDNVTGWAALLGPHAGEDGLAAEGLAYAAPARAAELGGLPAAYIEVGDLDVFRAEDVAYADRLAAAGVPAELHVHAGVPHAFEVFAPASAVAQRAMADRIRVLAAL